MTGLNLISTALLVFLIVLNIGLCVFVHNHMDDEEADKITSILFELTVVCVMVHCVCLLIV